MEPSPRWLLILKDVAQIAGPIATAIIAAIGLKIARDGLRKWQTEEPGKRRLAVAEEALRRTYAASIALKSARRHTVTMSERMAWKDATFDIISEPEAMRLRYDQIDAVLREFDDYKPHYGVHFGREAMRDFDDLIGIIKEIRDDLSTLSMSEPEHGFPVPEEKRMALRKKFFEPTSDPSLDLDARIDRAIDKVRKRFELVVAGERTAQGIQAD
ncbi:MULTISPECIES: hypothetical protein [Hyphomicrobiales]|jgi:hypothetical protein|uniref:hypothetical protein n=1 Tax=Methylobacterium sp. CCH7-A2 TaxID=1768789 RepID=UPI00082D0595|nr:MULTISPECIES: hypothetical protein [Hyphomicrobiales]